MVQIAIDRLRDQRDLDFDTFEDGYLVSYNEGDDVFEGVTLDLSSLMTKAGGTFTGGLIVDLAASGEAFAVVDIPPASDVQALVRLGGALVGGSAAGTYLGGNAPIGSTADLFHFQLDGTSRFVVGFGGNINTYPIADRTGLTTQYPGSSSADLICCVDSDGITTLSAIRWYGGLYLRERSTTSGQMMVLVGDQAGNTTYQVNDNGNTFFTCSPTTALEQDHSSPTLTFTSAFWNGSASVPESWSFRSVRAHAVAANCSVIQIVDQNGLVPIAISGTGGAVSIGYEYPNAAFLGARGQLFVESRATGTPTQVIRALTGQSANLLEWQDDGGVLLLGITPAGHMVGNALDGTKIGTAPSQKFSVWGAPPVVQPAAVPDADGTLAGVNSTLNTLLARLRAPGFIAT